MADPASLLAASRRELARLPVVLRGLLDDVDEEAARQRPAPSEWAPVEIACHLRDEETEDFGARLRAVLDGRDAFDPIDPERWAIERAYLTASLPEVLSDLCERRRRSLELLAAVDAPALRSVVQRRAGPLSGLDILAAWVAHDRLHVQQLAGTLARLWAMRWPSLAADYAGPIPYPPSQSG